MKNSVKAIAILMICLLLFTGCAGTKPEEMPAFEAKLDTTKTVQLNVASFFGNFEALDEVFNHFAVYYPNVALSYEFCGDSSSEDFLKNNPQYDIFMTSNERGYATGNCLDLIAAGVDVREIRDSIIEGNKRDGVLYSLPMSLTLKGMVVNKTLLAKEGLFVPETWEEFLTVLETLKNKGYTPIQGPASAVGTLCNNMGMSMLASDPALFEAACAGDAVGAVKLKAVYERIQSLMEGGYIDAEVNATYPENNYDGAILKFLEGDVPFWVCDTEKVSGMKKRESKSEAFKTNPFEYEFMFAPLGESGAYEYIEPWYGFAVNKDSEVKEYAVEFLRFMAYRNEMNTLASVKGVPAVTKISTDTRYANIANVKSELAVVSNGSVPSYYGLVFSQAAYELLTGNCQNAEEAYRVFLEKCAAA